MQVTVDSQITLAKKPLSSAQVSQIKESLTIFNPERDLAQREKIGGWWNIPKEIFLYDEDQKNLYLPRGFAEQLAQGLDIDWKDNRILYQVSIHDTPVDVRDYQEIAIQKLLEAEQGIWKSPPGSGKTVAILELIRRSKQKSLIIVNTTNIAEQWRERAKQFLGVDIGLFGDTVRDEKDITVAIQQTLWSRRNELEREDWFNAWGLVCLDEVHHLPAITFTDILSRFGAFYRFGVSGTPYKQKEFEEIIWATIGPLITETKKEDLIKEGWLIKPEINIYETYFNRTYIPTHIHKNKKKITGCSEFARCQRDPKKARHQNNYSDIMNDLVSDHHRNFLIASNIAEELIDGETILVLSKRLKHLDAISQMVWEITGNEDYIFQFTGRQTTQERMEIAERAAEGSCVLFSTIADEALDIPRASRIHFAWPTKNTDIIRQQIGRIERPHPEKKSAIVSDYSDDVGPLKRQLEDRWREVYAVDQLEVNLWKKDTR